jgi:hypothetical protein
MKFLFLVLATTFTLSASALADHSGNIGNNNSRNRNNNNSQGASVCAAKTWDGNWAVHNDNYMNRACSRTGSFLRRQTREPVTQWNRFFLPYNRYNRVTVRCDYANQTFYGQGVYPLNYAFRYAKSRNLQGCMFY